MNSTSLRQLIKESIQEYIREIDQKGDEAAVKAKMEACEEAITLREKKIQAAESLEEVKDMVDPSKIKALKSEIKTLEKSLKKYRKQLDKMNSKAEKSEDTEEEKEIVDEVTIDEIGHEADSQLEEAKKKKKKEEKELMNESFLYMQKLAGVITEAEYKQKKSLTENQDKPTHKSKVDWYYIEDNSDYSGPKGRTVPDAEGFDNPKEYKGTELYIAKGTEGWVNGNRFEDEEGNDVEYKDEYFEKI